MHAMTYKGYVATIEFDSDIRNFHGQVINANSIITFYGSSIDELEAEFAQSMEVYFKHCKKNGIKPDKPYSGRLNLRASPDLHARLAVAAANDGKSLNEWAIDHLSHAA